MKKKTDETVKCTMLKSVGDAQEGDVVELDKATADKYVELGLAEIADSDDDEGQDAEPTEEADAEKRFSAIVEKSVSKLTKDIADKIEVVRKKIPAQPKETGSDDNPEHSFWVNVGRTIHNDQDVRQKAYNVLSERYGQKSTMTQGTATTGGWLVPVEYRDELLKIDGYEPGAFKDVRRVPTSVRTLNFPALDQTVNPSNGSSAFYGGVSIGVMAEGVAPANNTQPAFKQVSLVVKKTLATAQVSNELVYMSPISVDSILNELFRGATYAWAQWMIFNGSGDSTSWTGVLNSQALVNVERETAGHISLADCANMYAKLSPAARKRAKFYVSAAAIGEFPLLGNGYQLPMLLPKGAQSEMVLSFLGREIVPVECLPSLGTAGDLVLADMYSYIAAIGFDVRVEASPHFAFTQDVTTYRLSFLADGKPQLTAPIRLMNGTDEVSPFVALGNTSS